MQTKDTIYAYFMRQVKERPTALAVIDGRRRLTYHELDQLVNTIMTSFLPGPSLVGVVMDHSVEMVASILAVLKSGAAYIPVEAFFPEDRMRFMMNECHVDFVLTHRKYADRLQGFPLLFVEQGVQAEAGTPDLTDRSNPDDLAYILYTSGSTGLPKGVMVDNRNVCHYVRAFNHEFKSKPGDVMLQYSVCTFDIFVEEVFTTLLSGATLAIVPENAKSDIHSLMQYVESNKITIISGFPYLLLEMNKLEHIPSSVRLLISGGDVLRASFISNLLSQVEIYNTYGPSETTVCASYFRCNGCKPLSNGTYSIGKAVQGTQIQLLDDNLRPVPHGVVGEICISGDDVSRGYIGKRENEAFVTFPDGSVVYRSGDLGIMSDDGNLLFIRRKDAQIMIEGKRVEPKEVQNRLCQCAEVESGVVCSYTDEQGFPYLTAYVVPRNQDVFNTESVKRTMEKFLPGYMIPEFFPRIEFI